MTEIWIRNPDGNIQKIQIKNDQPTRLRNIFLDIGQNLPPFEFCLLIDENTNNVVSKNENLKSEIPYKLVDCREMIKCFNILRDNMNQKDKQILEFQLVIQNQKQQISSQVVSIADLEKQLLQDNQNKYNELVQFYEMEKEKNQNLQKECDLIRQEYLSETKKRENLENQSQNDKSQIKLKYKKQIDELSEKVLSFKNQIYVEQQKQQQFKELKEIFKTKYQKKKKNLKETIQEKSNYQSSIAGLQKDVEYLNKIIIEKENEIKKKEEEIKKKEEEYKTNLNNQNIQNENHVKRQTDRVKEVEQRYDSFLKDQLDLLNKNGLISSQNLQKNNVEIELSTQPNQIIKFEQQKMQFENQIEVKDKQIESLQNENNSNFAKIKQLIQNLQQTKDESQTLKKKLEELEKQILSLEKENESQAITIKNQLVLIEKEDEQLIKANAQVEQVEIDLYNTYKYRITRLVELIPRTHKDEINFAVEDLFSKKLYQKKGKLVDQTYKVYKLDYQKTKDLIFTPSNLNIKQSIVASHKSNIHGQLSLEKIVSDKKYEDKTRLVDSLQLFYSKSIDILSEEMLKIKSENSEKVYIIKETFTNQSIKIEEIEHSLDLLSGPIVAQKFLEAFVAELKNKNYDIPFKFQFVQPVLFSIQIHFKQFFSDLIAKQGEKQYTAAFQTIISLLNQMKEDKSNDFYSYIRELQQKKLEGKVENGKKQWEANKEAQTQFLESFINLCFDNVERDPFKNIVQQFNKCSNQEKFAAFNYLTDLLSDIYNLFPYDKFFYGYELDFKDINEKSVFKKYNGGTHPFDDSEEGKFLSALSYYSIKRSHEQQFCVSHIQGIGNYLYDPVVSSYDGLLNCFDQGYQEISYIESAFISSDPKRIGSKYIEALGISIN